MLLTNANSCISYVDPISKQGVSSVISKCFESHSRMLFCDSKNNFNKRKGIQDVQGMIMGTPGLEMAKNTIFDLAESPFPTE